MPTDAAHPSSAPTRTCPFCTAPDNEHREVDGSRWCPSRLPSAAPLDLDAHKLAFDERVVRHPNGHLMIERVPLPDEERIAKLFASLSKAWPVLAQHASHMDGEFDLALTDLRRVVKFLLAAARRGGADTESLDALCPEDVGPAEYIGVLERKLSRVAAVVRHFEERCDMETAGRIAYAINPGGEPWFNADTARAARAALPTAPPTQETDHAA